MIESLLVKIEALEKDLRELRAEGILGAQLYRHNLKLVKELDALRAELSCIKSRKIIKIALFIHALFPFL